MVATRRQIKTSDEECLAKDQARRSKEVFDNCFLILIDNLQYALIIVSHLTGDDFSRLFIASGRDSCMKAPLLGLSDGSDIYHLLHQRKPVPKAIPQLKMDFATNKTPSQTTIESDLTNEAQTNFLRGLKRTQAQIDLQVEKEELVGDWRAITDGFDSEPVRVMQPDDEDNDTDSVQFFIPRPSYARGANAIWLSSERIVKKMKSRTYLALGWREQVNWKRDEWKKVEASPALLSPWNDLAAAEKLKFEAESTRLRIGNLESFVPSIPLPLQKRLQFAIGFAGGVSAQRRNYSNYNEQSYFAEEKVTLLSLPVAFFVSDSSSRLLFLISSAETGESSGSGGGCGCCGSSDETTLTSSSMSYITSDGIVHPLVARARACKSNNDYDDVSERSELAFWKTRTMKCAKWLQT